MTAPFYQFGLFSQEVSLIIAFAIGISFGFFLEKGGLGNSLKLSGQFYLTDFTVFKVMFTAIVTAMLGLFLLSWIGFLDLSEIEFSQTYVIPYLIAGLLFGVGFVIGGLCPGTSIVSAATGKTDGIVLLFGVFFGIFLFGETFETFEEFLFSMPMYRISIPEYFSASHGAVLFIVTIIAVIGFLGAEKLEKRSSSKSIIQSGRGSNLKLSSNFYLGSTAIIFALVFIFVGDPVKPVEMNENENGILLSEGFSKRTSVEELAELIISRKNQFAIVDLRTSDLYDKYHIPGALCIENINADIELGKDILIYSEGNSISNRKYDELNSRFGERVHFLDGGINAWYENILFPDLTIPNGSAPEILKKKERLSRFFGGTPKVSKNRLSKGQKYSREGC